VDSTDVINPATGAVFRSVPSNGLAETDAAIDRAQRAFLSWREVAPGDRARLLRRFAAVVGEHIEELAGLEVLNSGHTIGNARWEAGNVRDVLDFPMPIAGWGFAPALAAGNTVVLKPAEVTPLTAVRLGELALEAGLPEDVFTVLPGKGRVVGQRFVTHPAVRKVCFTGSTEVGKSIMAGCADQVKRVTLELGGKSANIVFADADLERAAASAPGGVFDNAGQDCCSRSRLLVQDSVYDRFLALLEPAVKAFRVQDPALETAEMGPLISAEHRAKVASYTAGADVAFAGEAPAGDGWWFPPTVLLARSIDDPHWREEVFGPVLSVLPFRDEAEAIRLANDTEYGLSGSIWTRDLGRALRVSRGVETGNLSVNSHSSVRYWTPFGGMKQSGLGRELGPDALLSFTDVKNVFISTDS
jgi:acyl-CoA reductase-like NAD-dependent aldehyde dehydrogenase